jgi:hypothetical protein
MMDVSSWRAAAPPPTARQNGCIHRAQNKGAPDRAQRAHPCGVAGGMTIIDGIARTQRSRDTPPATPEIIVGH